MSPRYLANAGPLRLVLEKARAEARDRWAKLTLPQRREITSTLMVVRILPTVRGTKTFCPQSVAVEGRAT